MAGQARLSYWDAVFTGVWGGGYLGAVIGMYEILLSILIGLLELGFRRGMTDMVGAILTFCLLVYFTGGLVAYLVRSLAIMLGAITGGIPGLISGVIGGILYLALPKDEDGGSSSQTRIINAYLSALIFGGAAFIFSALIWFQWNDRTIQFTGLVLGSINVLVFVLAGGKLGYMIGQFDNEDIRYMDWRTVGAMDLNTPLLFFTRITEHAHRIGEPLGRLYQYIWSSLTRW